MVIYNSVQYGICRRVGKLNLTFWVNYLGQHNIIQCRWDFCNSWVVVGCQYNLTEWRRRWEEKRLKSDELWRAEFNLIAQQTQITRFLLGKNCLMWKSVTLYSLPLDFCNFSAYNILPVKYRFPSKYRQTIEHNMKMKCCVKGYKTQCFC